MRESSRFLALGADLISGLALQAATGAAGGYEVQSPVKKDKAGGYKGQAPVVHDQSKDESNRNDGS